MAALATPMEMPTKHQNKATHRARWRRVVTPKNAKIAIQHDQKMNVPMRQLYARQKTTFMDGLKYIRFTTII